jgi:hypothetical protein
MSEWIDKVEEAQRAWLAAAATGGTTAASATNAALRGMREAALVILDNLARAGYPRVPGIIEPVGDVDARISRIEEHTGGRVPPVLAAFWRIVGGFSLVDLEHYSHVAFWESRDMIGVPEYCDGVHIDACDDDWEENAIAEFDSSHEEEHSFLLSLAPDGYHKDDISGGPAYGMSLGNDWLAPFDNFSWVGRVHVAVPGEPCDLLTYLRCSLLECAGFPALYGVLSFESMRADLLRGVPVF